MKILFLTIIIGLSVGCNYSYYGSNCISRPTGQHVISKWKVSGNVMISGNLIPKYTAECRDCGVMVERKER
jgi:hypothetical protein